VRKVRIDRAERDGLRTRELPPVDDAGREAHLSGAVQAAHRIPLALEAIDDRARPVRRVVVDDDDLAVEAVLLEHIVERRDETLDAVGFLVGRDDDRKLHLSFFIVGKRAASNGARSS
jgi:hypothetical protein